MRVNASISLITEIKSEYIPMTSNSQISLWAVDEYPSGYGGWVLLL